MKPDRPTIYGLAALLVLVVMSILVAPARAEGPPSEPAVADAAQSAATIPQLTTSDLDDIRNFARHQEDADKATARAQDAAAVAQAKQEKAQAVLAAVNYKILAKHKLDPDEYVIDLVPEKQPDGSEARAWKIIKIPKAAPSPK
jgi:hypothetical protein